jgi:hypothetical protein
VCETCLLERRSGVRAFEFVSGDVAPLSLRNVLRGVVLDDKERVKHDK